LSFTHWTQTTS